MNGDEDFECVDLSIDEWICEELIKNRLLEDCFLLIQFKTYVEKFTRNSYIRFRLSNWKRGWNKFLKYTQPFTKKELRKYLQVYNENKILERYFENGIEMISIENLNVSRIKDMSRLFPVNSCR